ncbi:MAG: transglycosylase SLT domain-containing protein [Treponema sp.]|nr:transglycosylase SLT domain-containing protein [Treponema sp.]
MKNNIFWNKSLFFTLSFLFVSNAIFAQGPLPDTAGGIQIPKTQYASEMIQKYIDQYSKPFGKKQLFDTLDNGELYRLYVRQELKKRKMPAALEYLPVVESEYNPLAVSRSGARGLWQFMDNSIAPFLKKTQYVDERYDAWKSTDAALTKLMDNYTQFKDWPIAIAAYNCGAGAMKRILKQAKQKTFWYIAETGLLRDQSVQYVPKLLAICILSEHGQSYGFEIPQITTSTRYAEFDYITTKEQISLSRLASELKMDEEILKKLNASLLQNYTPPSSIYQLRLPSGMKESARIAIEEIKKSERPSGKTLITNTGSSAATGRIHTVQKGETLWSISRLYGVPVDSIRKANSLGSDSVLSIGKILYIP